MNDTAKICFECPHCGKIHEKHIDTGVFWAEIHFRCAADEGGCGQSMIVFFGDNYELHVHPLHKSKAMHSPAAPTKQVK